jgi:hypothetical protein
MAIRRFAFVATGAVIVAAVSLGSPGRPASAAAPAIAFSTPSVVDPIHTYGEPDILIDPQGPVYVSGPTGTGTQRSVWNASFDGGRTYRLVAQGTPPSPLIGNPAPQPGGGDTELSIDHTSKVYFADLYALACLRVATTTDHGATTQQNVFPGGCAAMPGSDRQWMAMFDPPSGRTQSAYQGPFPLVYMEYNNLGVTTNGSAQWVKSTDGLNYSSASLGGEFGADGYPSIDQVTGKVFQAEYDGSGSNSCGTTGSNIFLNVGTPDATGHLTFLDDPNGGSTTHLIPVAHNVPDNTGEAANFMVSSMDSGRNLWVAWVGRSCDPSQRQVWVSIASAASGWTNWSAPVQVSAPPSRVSIFPWIKAGGPGRADVVWYGSDTNIDPSDPSGTENWDVYMSQVVFPTTNKAYVGGGASSVQQVKVTPHPMHFGAACLQGTGCIAVQGNRNLADFFEVTIDRTGAAEVVYDDTSNGLCQQMPPITPNGDQTLDHCGAPVVAVARQSQGPGLLGTNVFGPSNAPISGQPDNRGDALYPVIGGTNVPGMDILSNQLQLNTANQTLTVTEKIVDLSNPAATALETNGGAFQQYVTRWQMGNTIYFAEMETTPTTPPHGQMFFAGKAESIDLCSVSACFPHVVTYPEPLLQQNGQQSDVHAETGNVTCPSAPSATNPCTLTITVSLGHVGSPTASSLLEEVGSYSLASSHPAGYTAPTVQAQEDNVPLEIDGVCCFNFQASVANGGPPPCHEADGDGHVADGRGGQARVRFDEDACEEGNSEGVQEQDASTGDSFQSTSTSSVTFDDVAGNVTIAGTGTHNANPVTFTLIAVNGAAGVGSYVLTLSDGYVVSGSLLDGSVQLQ